MTSCYNRVKIAIFKSISFVKIPSINPGAVFTLKLLIFSFVFRIVSEKAVESKHSNSLFQIRCARQAQRRLLDNIHALLLGQMAQVPIFSDSAARLHLAHHLSSQ